MKDLFGNPLATKPFPIDRWQKRQATLLYHYTSKEYLHEIRNALQLLCRFCDGTLDKALADDLDHFMAVEGWDIRDRPSNWSTNAHPMLGDLMRWLNTIEGDRVTETYRRSGVSSTFRGMDEYSTQWVLPDQYERYEKIRQDVTNIADRLDRTVNHRYDDTLLAWDWLVLKYRFPQIPRLRVRTDVEGESGKRPHRTGVYVPQDDPLGTLQFAWTGNEFGALEECVTFNDISKRLMQAFGREAMWDLNNPAVMPWGKSQPDIWGPFDSKHSFLSPQNRLDPGLLTSWVSSNGFTKRPCRWYFVEMVSGEFEDEEETISEPTTVPARLRCPANQPCPKEGFWLTPAKADSRRHFKAGEVMPDFGSAYGETIWQWDETQS